MKLGRSISRDPRPVDAIVIGENSIDLVATVDEFPAGDDKREMRAFAEMPGGEGATASVALARLGWRTSYLGRYGDDRMGTMGRALLQAEGVNVADAPIIPGAQSRVAVVLVQSQGGARAVLWQRSSAMAIEPADLREESIAQARVLLVGSDDVPSMTAAARIARRHDVRTVGDLERIHEGTDALLRELDVIVMAAAFPEALTGESSLGAAVALIARTYGAALTCVTLGEQGCLAVAEGREVRIPAFRVPVVDTTGAGDLFRAGLIARWLSEPEGPDITSLLRYASAVAALGCGVAGAQAGAPCPAQVEALLAR